MPEATHRGPATISAHLASFRMQELAAELRSEAAYRKSGKNARTLVKDPELTLVLTALRKDAVIRAHRAPASAALFLIDGEILFTDPGPDTVTRIEPGQMLAFPGNFSHSLKAARNSTFLLAIGVRHPTENGVPHLDRRTGVQ